MKSKSHSFWRRAARPVVTLAAFAIVLGTFPLVTLSLTTSAPLYPAAEQLKKLTAPKPTRWAIIPARALAAGRNGPYLGHIPMGQIIGPAYYMDEFRLFDDYSRALLRQSRTEALIRIEEAPSIPTFRPVDIRRYRGRWIVMVFTPAYDDDRSSYSVVLGRYLRALYEWTRDKNVEIWLTVVNPLPDFFPRSHTLGDLVYGCGFACFDRLFWPMAGRGVAGNRWDVLWWLDKLFPDPPDGPRYSRTRHGHFPLFPIIAIVGPKGRLLEWWQPDGVPYTKAVQRLRALGVKRFYPRDLVLPTAPALYAELIRLMRARGEPVSFDLDDPAVVMARMRHPQWGIPTNATSTEHTFLVYKKPEAVLRPIHPIHRRPD